MRIPSIKAVSIASMMKDETLMIKAAVAVSAVILAGVLIGLSRYGIDLSAVFLGTPWNSPLAHTRGTIAIEGGIVAVTLLFGGLFLGGVITLIRKT